MSAWEEVFGAPWFWIAAALVWARAAGGAYGVSRRLIRAARRDPAAVELAHRTVCWRLGPGRLWPASLDPLRWPVFGLVVAVLLVEGGRGHALALALATAVGPILAVGMALEPMVTRVAFAMSSEDAASRAGFLEVLDQALKARLAAALVSGLATAAAATIAAPR